MKGLISYEDYIREVEELKLDMKETLEELYDRK